ncbi:MAG: DUF1553 domain-containing protein [Candidatus Hydrogenedentes bacterium]|nr:DUF1553 domain-containing protein [Candidatus Hydrogenedentota bacterium]
MNGCVNASIGLGVAALCVLATFPALADPPLPARVEFNRHIRPILSNNCFFCHGPDPEAQKAKLRLDRREDATAAREGHAAIVPGDLATSALIGRILTDSPDDRMPPPASNHTLSAREKTLLQRWVEQGAEYESHWAYIAPKRTAPPEFKNGDWARNPVDEYILADLERQHLTPAQEADDVTLIRRLSFDLVGLPPTPDEVADFISDRSDAAYEGLVNRLLASPHFGERLAIHWLDLVRYADTVGYHGDQIRGAAPYRDYVIAAFNDNMPFDQFTRGQLAGDLLEDPTIEQRIATGYNRLNMVTREGGAQDKDYLIRYAADRTRTTASVWLGSSLGCAQCHDHKFDPFTTKDFYRFSAFFADIKEVGVQTEAGNSGPFPPYLLFPNEEQAEKIATVDADIARLREALQAPETEGAPSADSLRKELRSRQEARFRLEQETYHSVVTETMKPRVVRVLARGNWMDESGEIVTPGIPAFLGDIQTTDRLPTRLDLANWLTDPKNPLTARVFVNRLWKLYFGTGISKVLDDLGSQGEWPAHPELLDYLALEFMESGWDIKHVVKLMVMSSTYRQTSKADATLKNRDPYNRLLARQSRFRLEAELIRDNALKVSGLLSTAMGGPSAKPYQPAGYYSELNFPKREYQPDTGENLYRRGVYTHWQRTFLHPSLLAFDAPTREECTAERPISNSPLQALVLLNDPTFVEAARVFAQRILKEGGLAEADRIAWAYQEALSRFPLDSERAIMHTLLDKHTAQFAARPATANDLLGVGEQSIPKDADPVQLAAWTSVARTLFNTHEMIYRY